MTDPLKGYISLQEAADLLKLSRQSIYRRLSDELSADSNPDTKTDSSGQPADSRPASIVQGKKRYLSMDWVLAELDKAEPVNDQADSSGQSADTKTDSKRTVADSSADSHLDRILQLEKDLLAAQGGAAALRATIAAQEAHIDSLKRALDAEQALHMASLQQRLPAPGRGFFAWIRGKTGESRGE